MSIGHRPQPYIQEILLFLVYGSAPRRRDALCHLPTSTLPVFSFTDLWQIQGEAVSGSGLNACFAI